MRHAATEHEQADAVCHSPIGRTVTVTIDRPMHSRHPDDSDIVYPINYGFVEGVPAGDGEWQDAYVLGVDATAQSFTGVVIAVIHRRDDVEDKWVVAPSGTASTVDEIAERTRFQERYFDSWIQVRPLR